MNRTLRIIIGIIAATCLLGGGLWLVPKFFSDTLNFSAKPPTQQDTTSSSTDIVVSTQPSAPQDSVQYTNSTYHFSLLYPKTLSIKEYSEKDGGHTITFQSLQEGRGFQIYIISYAGSQISEARFKEDLPSGVRKNVTSVSIDGATGAAFYSTDQLLGDTAEVWFLHGGYLYEVTTLKELTPWFDPIVQTWKFI